MSEDRMLSLPQAAKYLGVGRTTLWRMHAEYGLLPPPTRVSPGRVGYPLSVLVEYQQQQRAAS